MTEGPDRKKREKECYQGGKKNSLNRKHNFSGCRSVKPKRKQTTLLMMKMRIRCLLLKGRSPIILAGNGTGRTVS